MLNTHCEKKSSFSGDLSVDQLSSLLKIYQDDIKVLSLDCFDTLIWRKTNQPTDHFQLLSQQPTFQSLGFNAHLRIKAETHVRKRNWFYNKNAETHLKTIYHDMDQRLTPAQLEMLAAEELATDKSVCFSLPAFGELILKAKMKNIKIIIVSDTYYSRNQLMALLKACLPAPVYQCIDRVYSSSEEGTNKSASLFFKILTDLKVKTKEVLHIGDNEHADVISPKKLGIHAYWFKQYAPPLQMHLENLAALDRFIQPSSVKTPVFFNPYKGILGSTPPVQNAIESVGHMTLGPLFFSFACFINQTLQQLQAERRPFKVAFLMRDGFLPEKACEAFFGQSIGVPLKISRFVAFALSFDCEKNIVDYLIEQLPLGRFADILNQLLFTADEVKTILADLTQHKNPQQSLKKHLILPDTLALIHSRAIALQGKFKRYIDKTISLTSGETLLLIDLGYSGTVQTLLTNFFKNTYQVTLFGCYMFALDVLQYRENRAGLFTSRDFDQRLLSMIIANIALLEQLSTSAEGSVIGYDNLGIPILSQHHLSTKQTDKLIPIQAAVKRFIKETKAFFDQMPFSLNKEDIRPVAIASLVRLIFLPSELELDYLKSFQFELNLGTNVVLNLFDATKGQLGLRRRGFNFMERNLEHMRTNYPAELRATGLEMSALYLMHYRFNLPLNNADVHYQKDFITIHLTRDQEKVTQVVEAIYTHEGYFMALFPLCKGHVRVDLHLASKHAGAHMDCAHLIHSHALFKNNESDFTMDISPHIINSGFLLVGKHCYVKQHETNKFTFNYSLTDDSDDVVLKFIYRPLALT